MVDHWFKIKNDKFNIFSCLVFLMFFFLRLVVVQTSYWSGIRLQSFAVKYLQDLMRVAFVEIIFIREVVSLFETSFCYLILFVRLLCLILLFF